MREKGNRKKSRPEGRSKISSRKSEPRRREKFSGKPELLSPAGNLESFFAAIDGGADAVYLGLDRFNARMRADNFSVTDLSRLVPYAREKGVKVYIAMNTQILESELPTFIDMVSKAQVFKPHAFILGDLGAIGIIREHFPRLKIHASTLMGNLNSRTLATLASLGVSRAVMERHIPLSQLRDAVRRSPIDVELFVHGALCFSYSGACFFSSFLGGKSGNRGECVQPCRRVYSREDGRDEKAYFSAKDLCLLEKLPELMTLGVRAFKIEGRLRDGDHIYNVVSAYRHAIDMIHEGKPRDGIREGMKILEKTVGRERTEGAMMGQQGSSTVSSEGSGAVGEFLGRVVEVSRPFAYFGEGVDVKKGERLRIQDVNSGGGTGFTLTSLSRRGGKTWLKVPFEVKKEDLLLRVSRRSDRKIVTGKALERYNTLPSRGIDFWLEVSEKHVKIIGSVDGFKREYGFRIEGKGGIHDIRGKDFMTHFKEAYSGDMPLGNIEVDIIGGSHFTLHDLVSAFSRAAKKFDKAYYLFMKEKRLKVITSLRLRGRRKENSPTGIYIALSHIDHAEEFKDVSRRVILDFTKNLVRKPHRLMSLPRDRAMLRLPPFLSDSQITFFRAGIEKAVRMGFREFVVPDLCWVKVFRELGVERKVRMVSDHYLYTFNIASCLTLSRIGFSRFILPVESNMKNIEKEGVYLKELGIFPAFMKLPLLITSLRPSGLEGEERLISKMGENFYAHSSGDGTTIYSDKRFSVSGYLDRLMNAGIKDFLIDLRGTELQERRSIVQSVLNDIRIEGTVPFNLFRNNL